ncbi:MAG: transglycosylase SLT domain-containing protein [Saprospiraceae bacterium]|nr:transglycosylase SLT domain-containing protein [Saprospiraceae bacterium]
MTYKSLFILCIVVARFSLSAATLIDPIGAIELRDKILANYSEEDIIDRLKSMQSIVDVSTDQDVLDQVKRFVLIDRTFSKRILYRKDLYFPLIDQTFGSNQLPLELKYIAAIESGLNPSAKSGVGAAGLWQFMVPTAKNRGLRVDDKVDQRFDPVQSTRAAASYFNSLYQMFGDWTLVLAAYNCGEYKVIDAIQKSGSKNYWEVRKYLPRQTQLFVPAFIGLSYMLHFAETHNLYADNSASPSELLTFIKINRELNIDKMTKSTGIQKELFKSLNPGYRKNIIPKSESGHYIALPDSLAVEFVEYYSSMPNPDKNNIDQVNVLWLPGGIIDLISFARPLVEKPETIEITQPNPLAYETPVSIEEKPELAARSSKNYTYHIVKTKESLSDIAALYDSVSIDDLMEWNELNTDMATLARGTVLIVKK